MSDTAVATLLDRDALRLDAVAASRDDAVRLCGSLLVGIGAVEQGYVELMLEREASVSTYVGEGVAIPHGTLAGRDLVRRDALCVARFPAGVDWGTGTVFVCIGIAAAGDGHLSVLAELAQILLEPSRAAALRAASTPEDVWRILAPGSAVEVTPGPHT
jgi:PTS system mannitol-specific IIA component